MQVDLTEPLDKLELWPCRATQVLTLLVMPQLQVEQQLKERIGGQGQETLLVGPQGTLSSHFTFAELAPSF